MYTHTSYHIICAYIYIYTYRERERERVPPWSCDAAQPARIRRPF